MTARYGPRRGLAEIAPGLPSDFGSKHQFSLPECSVVDLDKLPTTFLLLPRRWAALLSNHCSLCSPQELPPWAAHNSDPPCIRRAKKLRAETNGRNAVTDRSFLVPPCAMWFPYLP